MLKHLIAWLQRAPTERPADLIAFEESQQRKRDSSYALTARSDAIGKMIAQMTPPRRRDKRKAASCRS